ncbi:hypothetical protein T439DRAFT_320519 [Meredithblackwellia eburnea MCA 4105]
MSPSSSRSSDASVSSAWLPPHDGSVAKSRPPLPLRRQTYHGDSRSIPSALAVKQEEDVISFGLAPSVSIYPTTSTTHHHVHHHQHHQSTSAPTTKHSTPQPLYGELPTVWRAPSHEHQQPISSTAPWPPVTSVFTFPSPATSQSPWPTPTIPAQPRFESYAVQRPTIVTHSLSMPTLAGTYSSNEELYTSSPSSARHIQQQPTPPFEFHSPTDEYAATFDSYREVSSGVTSSHVVSDSVATYHQPHSLQHHQRLQSLQHVPQRDFHGHHHSSSSTTISPELEHSFIFEPAPRHDSPYYEQHETYEHDHIPRPYEHEYGY